MRIRIEFELLRYIVWSLNSLRLQKRRIVISGFMRDSAVTMTRSLLVVLICVLRMVKMLTTGLIRL
jgi:hypothetical protein